ncbi:MAG: CopG family transcriptional regulator [Deltaproteobacteria bacterium RBG_13_47_9]|nr:MAG: CopG family transcriptional regulator [Deltaproteobacteria bacterium RBG_13_47_9]
MKKKVFAKSSDEFDRRFDAGEDIHALVDMSQATVTRPGRKVRLTLDVSEALVKDLDEIRNRIGVDRSAIIKVWLHERVKQEKAMS